MELHSAEDRELYEKLRAKYAPAEASITADATSTHGLDVPVPSSFSSTCHMSAPRDEGTPARICITCQGLGVVIEDYNHRRMEKFCVNCDGGGIILGPTTAKQTRSMQAEQQAGPPRKGSSSQQPQALLARLQAKLAAYTAELAELRAADTAGLGPAAAAARSDLAAALSRHISKLQRLQANQQAQLALSKEEVA
ncbi:hypothetical protein QJQ45_002514 [Haematococcus lacustris]|nr:hypothetical protein QJQ45_002514 [Haematococcus lacustris]